MDASTRQLLEAFHRTAYRCALALTGGGTTAAGLLLSVPGGSRTILEVAVPYDEVAFADYLGQRPAQYCSAAASRDLAARAYHRACHLAPAADRVLGLGCTASLVSDRPKRGDHRCHVTVQTEEHLTTHSLVLTKGARDREGEEAVLDAVLLNALAEACGLAERVTPALLPGEAVQTKARPLPDPIAALLRGDLPAVCMDADGRVRVDAPYPAALLPGAFNPVHDGHWQLAALASRLLEAPVAFEMSVTNVDKPPLTAAEVRRRLGQFTWRMAVWVTRAPTFVEKASRFPGAVFVVGADTAARVVDLRYHQGSADQVRQALDYLRAQGCRFLVAGREDRDSRFVGCDDLAIPDGCRDLFRGLSQAEFHVPLSSTALRTRQTG